MSEKTLEAFDASTNLHNWTEVTNLFSTNGTFQFTDWLSNAPARFFRARLP